MLTLTTALASATAVRADEFYGVTPQAQLVTFDRLARSFRTPLPLSGLAAGETVVAMDARPSTGGLYGIAQKGAVLRPVRIDQATGALTTLGAGVTLPSAPASVGMDFNPADDLIHVSTTTGSAVTFNPVTGAVGVLAAATPAGADYAGIAYLPDPPFFSPLAVESVGDTFGLGSGSGGYAMVGALGANIVSVAGADVGLDIGPDGTVWMAAMTSQYKLFRIGLNGSADDLGPLDATLAAFCVRLTGPAAFGAPAFGVGEGDGTASIVVHRDSPSDGVARVAWTTADGTATAGADYTAASGVITFARDETAKTVTVPITQDATAEGTERFAVRLTSVDGVGAGPDTSVLIGDDDQPVITPLPPPLPPPPPPAPPTVDKTAPVILGLPLTLKLAKSLKLPYAVSEAGTGTLTLRLGAADAKKLKLKRVLATAKLTVRVGTNSVTVKLPAKTYTALRKRKKLAVSVEIVALDGAANRGAGSYKLTLHR